MISEELYLKKKENLNWTLKAKLGALVKENVLLL
jgi:hypothetical protein